MGNRHLILVLVLLRGAMCADIVYMKNQTGSFCVSNGRTRFLSENVVPEIVATRALYTKTDGWLTSNLASVSIGVHTSLTHRKLANAIPMKSLNQSVIVSWNSDMIDIEIVGSQAATYTLDIVIDNHTLSFSCEKHCQLQTARLERRKKESVLTFLNKTKPFESVTKFFTLETNQPNLFVRILDVEVFHPPMYKYKNMIMEIETQADSICINYWKKKQSSAVATLQLGDGNYRLDGVGFNSIEIETSQKEFTAQVIYRKSNSDDVQSGIEFLLLKTMICEKDIVRTHVKTSGCANDTSIAVLTSDSECLFMKCECGLDCKVCTANGCGCMIEEEVASCKHFEPPTLRPTTSTKAPPSTTRRPQSTSAAPTKQPPAPTTTKQPPEPPSTTRRPQSTSAATTKQPPVPTPVPAAASGHTVVLAVVWTGVVVLSGICTWLVVIYIKRVRSRVFLDAASSQFPIYRLNRLNEGMIETEL